MGFWFGMLGTVVLIPLLMIIIGAIFSKKAPKNINYVFGYRTARSMKNQETWEFSHLLLGKIWLKCGLISIVVSIIPMFFVLNKCEDIIGNLGLVILYLQLAMMIITIIIIENSLRKTFDKNGNRKN